MYLDNEKISRRQMKRLIVFNVFSISWLIISRLATYRARKDGLISIILALFFAFLFIIFIGFITKNTSGNIMKYSKDKCPKIITFIVGVFYIIKYFACLVLCGRLFAEVIKETLLEDADVRFIILMLLLISAYSASKGFEVRARITELLYFIVLIPVIIFLLLGLKSVDPSNLLPLFTESKQDVLLAGYSIFIIFTSLEFLIFSMHYIQEKPVKSIPEGSFNDKQEKSIKIFKNSNLNYILNALLIVGIIVILIYVVTVGILGTNDTSSKLWSTINMIQIVELPGGFLQRHDALMISIWMLSIFTLTSGFLYYILMISKKLLKIPSQNYMILPFLILLLAACIIPIDIERYFYYFEQYMMTIGIPGSILLPLLILVIGNIRDYFKKNRVEDIKNSNEYEIESDKLKMKYTSLIRGIILLFSLPVLFSLTACSDMTEIEDRNFIQSIGVDYVDEEITVTLESPDLNAFSDEGSSDEEEKEKLLSNLKGKDFYEIEEKYLYEDNKRMDFSHLQVIIFGKEFLENKYIYEEFLDYVGNQYEISRNTLIFMSSTKAEEIMELNPKLDSGIGNFLHQLYRINVINKGREEVKLQNLLFGKKEGGIVARIPIVELEDGNILVKGAGFIKDSELAYNADLLENDFINIARGFADNTRIFIEDEFGDTKFVIKINQIDQAIEFEEKDNKPFVIIRIEGDAKLEKGLENFEKVSENMKQKSKDSDEYVSKTGNRIDELEEKKIKEINLECNQYIHNQIIKLLEEISKKEQVDFLNLYRKTYGNKELWLNYRDKPDEFLEDFEYIVEVNIGL